MRASRLVALLLWLQERGAATADELAETFEVSTRTIYRDVAALQASGVPLWTETGPGGGVRLVEGWRTNLDGLTADEATALFIGGTSRVAGALGLGTVLIAAQTKVLSTLPPELRGRAGRVRERFLLDAPGWFHTDEPLDHLPAISDALWSDRRIDITYERRDGVVGRRLDPLGLVLKAGVWYLVARHRTDVRTYRVGRIVTTAVLDATYDRPADFDLTTWWSRSQDEFNQSILHARVRLRLSPDALRWLPHHMDQAAVADALQRAAEPDDEGWRTVDVAVESHRVAISQLMALAPGVEVVSPASVRRAFAAIGTEMARRNAA